MKVFIVNSTAYSLYDEGIYSVHKTLDGAKRTLSMLFNETIKRGQAYDVDSLILGNEDGLLFVSDNFNQYYFIDEQELLD